MILRGCAYLYLLPDATGGEQSWSRPCWHRDLNSPLKSFLLLSFRLTHRIKKINKYINTHTHTHHRDSYGRFLFVPLIIAEQFPRCCSPCFVFLPLSYAPCGVRHKNNWCLGDPELQDFFFFQIDFGISILKVTAGSQRVSVMLRYREIIQTAKNNAEARHHSQTGPALPVITPPPLYSGSLMSYLPLKSLRREEAGPIIWKLKLNNGRVFFFFFGFGLLRRRLSDAEVTAPISSRGIASDVIRAPVLFRPLLAAVKAKEEIEIIKVRICIFSWKKNDSRAQGNALFFFSSWAGIAIASIQADCH